MNRNIPTKKEFGRALSWLVEEATNCSIDDHYGWPKEWGGAACLTCSIELFKSFGLSEEEASILYRYYIFFQNRLEAGKILEVK